MKLLSVDSRASKQVPLLHLPTGKHVGMANVLDEESLEVWALGTRICRRCGYELPVTADRAADHWYITKAGRLSPYCKVCTKRLTVERRRDRKAGVKPIYADCSTCGTYRKVAWEGDVATCGSCYIAMTASEGDLKLAMETVAWLHGHNKDVDERRERHNSDRMFIPHPEWIYGKYPHYDHRDCVKAEVSARAVVRFLATSRASGAAAAH